MRLLIAEFLPVIRGMTAPSFMDLALKAAENAGKAGEVPIGCVIVRKVRGDRHRRQPHPDRPRSDRACRNSGDPAGRRAPSAASGWSIATSMSRWSRARCAPARSRWRGSGGCITARPTPRAARWNPACGSLPRRPAIMCRRFIRRSGETRSRDAAAGFFQGAEVDASCLSLRGASREARRIEAIRWRQCDAPSRTRLAAREARIRMTAERSPP